MNGRFVRLAEQGRPTVSLTVDGAAVEALQGDTLMVALLTQGNALRQIGHVERACLGIDSPKRKEKQRRTPARVFQ